VLATLPLLLAAVVTHSASLLLASELETRTPSTSKQSRTIVAAPFPELRLLSSDEL